MRKTIFALLLTVLAGCEAAVGPELEEDLAEGSEDLRGGAPQPLPRDLADAPQIAAALNERLPGVLRASALFSTDSGFQIYRCGLGANGAPQWALRTPLAHLRPSLATAFRTERILRRSLIGNYHNRSDLGALLSTDIRRQLGLIAADGTEQFAPVWDLTLSPEGSVPRDWRQPISTNADRREVVAGRVLAQDTIGTGNIPALFIEVRGKADLLVENGIERLTATPENSVITDAEYILRWNLRGGVAPAAELCNAQTIGVESRQPYYADYYFIDEDRR